MDAASRDHYVEALRKASAHIRALTADQAARALERPIAIVGMGCRFPGGANDPERFWTLLERGGDAVAEIPVDRFDLDRWWSADPDAPGHIYVREAALIDDVRSFDPAFFRITPAEAEALDPQQRLLLEVSWEAFEDAAIDVRRLAGSRTGVFIGLSNYDYIQAHVHSGDPARITAYSGSGVMFSTAAGRLSYFYDLRGPCITLDTACSSSLVALDAAITALRQRDCDVALAGGVSLMLSPDSSVALCKVKALAADGRSRAFDDDATGYGRGEGCGLVVLKRLSDAVRDGDLIHGVLAGSAVNHDGRSNGLTAPNGLAQQAVLRSALADAGITPDRIDYVEAHGTGTPLGDPIEFGALDAVFGDRPRAQGLKLGSVKTNIGHTEAAAGIAGVIKAVLAIRHRTLPPSIHFDTPNRHIDWARSTLSVVAAATAWPETDHDPAVGVSSFGLSGTNAHVIVTAAPVSERAPPRLASPMSCRCRQPPQLR
ncbi:polyketide synthase [Sphingomonas aurantiaca]|uniref:type I polyketide synthase n=1 Tax=Sphingomonas aurantiaca TaxID=185949 RepID=UPI002FE04C22